ncbi:hypothetical protein HanIR_Chr08g0351511 [Helianthus annuus]|nr:hypothetical protein HanIR_Chr08g0351511 [Helianthus annuus]
MCALLEPSIRLLTPDIVPTGVSARDNSEKNFISLRIVLVLPLSTRHSSPIIALLELVYISLQEIKINKS